MTADRTNSAQATLLAVEIFNDFPPEVLQRLAQSAENRTFTSGDVIVAEGEAARAFYIIGAGKAEVVHNVGAANEEIVATLGPRSFFGEMALLREGARTATVRAAEELECLALSREAFEAEMRRSPNAAAVLMPRLARRIHAITHP